MVVEATKLPDHVLEVIENDSVDGDFDEIIDYRRCLLSWNFQI